MMSLRSKAAFGSGPLGLAGLGVTTGRKWGSFLMLTGLIFTGVNGFNAVALSVADGMRSVVEGVRLTASPAEATPCPQDTNTKNDKNREPR
jgi:hypothetical protein